MKNTVLSALVGAFIVALIAAMQRPTTAEINRPAPPDVSGFGVHPSQLRSYYTVLPAGEPVILDASIDAPNAFVVLDVVCAGNSVELQENGVAKGFFAANTAVPLRAGIAIAKGSSLAVRNLSGGTGSPVTIAGYVW